MSGRFSVANPQSAHRLFFATNSATPGSVARIVLEAEIDFACRQQYLQRRQISPGSRHMNCRAAVKISAVDICTGAQPQAQLLILVLEYERKVVFGIFGEIEERLPAPPSYLRGKVAEAGGDVAG